MSNGWPKASELAILTVNGQNYQDWESVTVKHAQKEPPFFTFRFTCSEGMPLSKNWAAMRIKPGDACTIHLAGQLAFAGLVHTRQVYYDANRHYIEIQGASNVLVLSYASVVHETGEENKTTWQALATKLCKKHGINVVAEGGSLPQTKIDRVSWPPGTTVMEVLETTLRGLPGVKLCSDLQSNLVAIVGTAGGQDTVVESQNILEGREIIYNPGMASGAYAAAQKPGGDDENMSKAAQIFHAGEASAAITQYAPIVSALEQPGFAKELLIGRNNTESRMQNEDYITVFITVQGWLRPSGGLWWRNQLVNVLSPMLIMDGDENLHAKSVTFTQDSRSGTRTVLELCNEKAMSQVAQSGTLGEGAPG